MYHYGCLPHMFNLTEVKHLAPKYVRARAGAGEATPWPLARHDRTDQLVLAVLSVIAFPSCEEPNSRKGIGSKDMAALFPDVGLAS